MSETLDHLGENPAQVFETRAFTRRHSRLRHGLLSVLVGLAACSGGDESPTPTAGDMGLPPGSGALVGTFLVMYGQGYDLSTGGFGGQGDVAATALAAAFIDSDQVAEGDEPGSLPFPFIIPTEGLALETCTFTEVPDELGGMNTTSREDGPSAPLTSVGDAVTVRINGEAVIEVPLVEAEDLPPPAQSEDIPPFYLRSADGLDESLYIEGGRYDLEVEGGEVVAGFSVDDVISPPSLMVVVAPDLSAGGAKIALGASADIAWSASSASYVGIDLRDATGAGLTCIVTDDGAFTIPAADMAKLAPGGGVLTIARVRIGRGEVRPGEWLFTAAGAAASGAVELSESASQALSL